MPTTVESFNRFCTLTEDAQEQVFALLRTLTAGFMAQAGEDPSNEHELACRVRQFVYCLDHQADREYETASKRTHTRGSKS